MAWDAIVIGAGFAGLSAGTALAEAGQRVLVLEARPGLGGRATAFTDPGTGERVDNGQHVFFGCYTETFRLLDRVSAREGLALDSRLRLSVISGQGVVSRLRCPPLPEPFHLVGGLLRWDALSWRDRLAAARLAPVLRALRAGAGGPARQAAADETVRGWLERHGQTPALITLLWEPLAVAALNQSIDEAGARPFLQVLAGLFGARVQDSALAIARRPLDELYALPAREYIERRGGDVRVQTRAQVHCGPELAVTTSRGDRVTAPIVVCAVAWYSLADLFADPPPAVRPILAAAAGTASSPIVTVNLWLDRPITDERVIGMPGRAMQWIFDKRALFGEQASHLSLVSSAARALVGLSNDAVVDLARRELVDAFPAAREATIRRAVVVREKRATFSVAPGQPPRPSTRTAMRGLFLAGDWIETGLPATIEGAVRSGHAAAAAALAP